MSTETQNPTLDLRVKYRPHKFRHLAQGLADPVVRSITRLIAAGMAIQALLLRGDFGVGKTTLIRLIGQRVSCVRQDLHPFEPCGVCESCQTVLSSPGYADLVGYSEFDVQRGTPRELLDSVKYHIPYGGGRGTLGPRKVIALDEFHRLGTKDQEKFVKPVEDWSRQFRALFILCATPNAEICPALVSRCTCRLITPPRPELIAHHLQKVARCEKYHLPREIAELLAAEAGYVPRDCQGLLQEVLLVAPPDHVVTRQVALDALDLWKIGRAQDDEAEIR